MEIYHHNHEVDLFFKLSLSKIKLLKSIMTLVTYKKGSIVTKPEERGSVYVVNTGRIELYENSKSGKFIYSVLKKGRIFGDFDLDFAPYIYARAIDDVTLEKIETKKFLSFLLNEPELLMTIFKHFLTRLLVVQRITVSHSTDSVLNRLVKLLIHLGKKNPLTEEMTTDKYTHEQLSQMLGISRQTTTTTINYLQKKSLLKRSKKTFIFDLNKFQNLIQ